jgi:cbb3-type cytochrome oxidase maturation protein
MDSIYLLIPIALLFTGIAIKAFFWAVDSKQFDDLESASKSILFDDDESLNPKPTSKTTQPNDLQQKPNDD